MDDEPADEATTNEEEKKEAERKRLEELREKVLFYLTAFFILLGIFSLFVFLFLVPFLIEPAITTIFMEFDETPITCVTAFSEMREGASNCSQPGGWASCREGCTKEIYECAQIFVNYTVHGDRAKDLNARHRRSHLVRGYQPIEPEMAKWTYTYARLFPNVKGCGYPPHLNCTVFQQLYFDVGASYPCYYSRVEPWTVITELNLAKSTRQLIYSMVFPIPCFVVSVVYVALAYFCVYAGRNRKPKMKRRVVRRMVGGGSTGGGGTGGGGSSSRAKTGSEATPLTNSVAAVVAPPPSTADVHRHYGSEDGRTGTPGSGVLLYPDDYDDDDDDYNGHGATSAAVAAGFTSGMYYGEQLRSTLAVDNSSAEYGKTLRLSEHTLRQSDSNEPSREWSEDEDYDAATAAAALSVESLDRSVKTTAAATISTAAPFTTTSTGYGFIGLVFFFVSPRLCIITKLYIIYEIFFDEHQKRRRKISNTEFQKCLLYMLQTCLYV